MTPRLPATRPRLWLLAACLCASGALAGPVTIYVAPFGNDHWSGRLPSANPSRTDGPLATLPLALEKSRAARASAPEAPIRLVLRGGTYALSGPLVFTPDDSSLLVAANPGETPVISGETPITGWLRSSLNSNLWQAPPPPPAKARGPFTSSSSIAAAPGAPAFRRRASTASPARSRIIPSSFIFSRVISARNGPRRATSSWSDCKPGPRREIRSAR